MSSVRDPLQVRAPAPEDELLRLDEELDLTDAAAPELHVVAGDRDGGMTPHGVDLALHRMDVGDGAVVEILAPDEGGEVASGKWRTKAEMSPATGRALISAARSQFWPVAFVVGEGGGQADGDRRRAGIGAQAQVHPQHVAVLGALARACLARRLNVMTDVESERRCARGRNRGGGGIEEGDDVDVAGIVQFTCTLFTEREDHESAPDLGIVAIGQDQLAGAVRLAQQRPAERPAPPGRQRR